MILFQDDQQRRYCSTVDYNVKKLFDEREMVDHALEQKAEDTGLILHYCESTEPDPRGLDIFRRIPQDEKFSLEYQKDIRKKLLKYYGENVRGEDLDDYLKEMEVTPIRADVVDRKEALKQSVKVSKTLKWELSRELMGSIQMHRDKVDGLILLSAFPCGPDSMVNEMIIRKFTGLPILNIVLDNQDGTAGLETRLESFTDILKLKKGVL